MFKADEITLRGLRYIKHTFQKAKELSRRKDEYARATCLLKLDNCVEWVSKLACKEYGEKVRNEHIPSLLKKLEDEIGGRNLERENVMDALHKKRNSVQHDMDIPGNRICKDYVKHLSEFLDNLTKTVWEVPFDEISLAPLVKSKKLREKISKAEEKIREKDYQGVIQECIRLFTYLVYGEEEEKGEERWMGLVGEAGKMTRVFSGTIPWEPLEEFETEEKKIKRLKKAIKNSLLKLGQSATTAQFFTPLQKIRLTKLLTEGKEAYTRGEAEDILDFTVDFILKIQEVGLPTK